MNASLLLLGSSLVAGQQFYIHATGPTPRPSCTATLTNGPSFTFRNFSYTLSDTVRYATSVQKPTITSTYAAPFSSVSSLLGSVNYTTWGSWNPNATVNATDTADPYGNAAWTSQWKKANPPNFTETSVYSSTVSPTPIPSSELVLPPKDYFAPIDCYNFPDGFMFGVSSSAAQIEGATAQEGKGPTLMDTFIQTERAKDYVTNEVYFYYKQV